MGSVHLRCKRTIQIKLSKLTFDVRSKQPTTFWQRLMTIKNGIFLKKLTSIFILHHHTITWLNWVINWRVWTMILASKDIKS